jgi:NTE family protein
MSEAGAGRASGAPTKVAIACQGGGSHTAFTAGFLRGVLAEWREDWELVGISGTSGGAFNAIAAWHGLVTEGPAAARETLADLWADLAADAPVDRASNAWLVGLSRVEAMGVPLPAVSPYDTPWARLGQRRLRRTLERHVPFEEVEKLCRRRHPRLVVGTVDVNGGEFETFVDEAVTAEAVLASAAVPDLFEGVEIHGHLHWDGLFSQNPPIDDLLTVPAERKPDELWVVQINPQTRDGRPTSLEEIADRRNELAGNISLNQELRTIERVNHWIDEGHLPESEFARTEIHRVEMDRAYHCSTKLDRSPEFVDELLAAGEDRAREFLAGRVPATADD